MAVVQMQRMNIFGLKADRKQILERVQRWGLMEVDIQLEDAQFSCSDTLAQRQQFDRQIRALQQALELLDRYAPEKKGLAGMLGGKTQITQAEYAAIVQDQAAVMRKANAMLEEEKSIAADQAAIAKLQAQQESLTPWLGLDVPMDAKGTARAALLCGPVGPADPADRACIPCPGGRRLRCGDLISGPRPVLSQLCCPAGAGAAAGAGTAGHRLCPARHQLREDPGPGAGRYGAPGAGARRSNCRGAAKTGRLRPGAPGIPDRGRLL